MDAFKDFFDNLKERVGSPFFISFSITWLIYNYPVILAILYFNKEKDFENYIRIIQRQFNPPETAFWLPLLWALLYTFGYPLFKNLARYVESRVVTYTDDKVLKDTDHHAISIENHIKIVRDANEAKAQLTDLINNADVYSERLKAAYEEVNTLKSDAVNNELKHNKDINELNRMVAALEASLDQSGGEIRKASEAKAKVEERLKVANELIHSITNVLNKHEQTLNEHVRQNESSYITKFDPPVYKMLVDLKTLLVNLKAHLIK